MRRAGAAERRGRGGSFPRRRGARPWHGRWAFDSRRARPARRHQRPPAPVRLHTRSRVLHTARILNRPASLGAGEGVLGLRRLPAVPHVRTARGGPRPRRAADPPDDDAAGERDQRARRVKVQPIAGGITAARGFRAAGVSAGIKASGALDVALIVPETPAAAAALFTTNQVQAAPVTVSREHLRASGGRVSAVLVNSGCANACTGADGLVVARESAGSARRPRGLSHRRGPGRLHGRDWRRAEPRQASHRGLRGPMRHFLRTAIPRPWRS